MALEYLHKKNIVYNNLKAENILLDIDGHIKLTDFGLSSEILLNESLAYTFGNSEALNPEIIQENNLKKSPDYYSLGCLLYQMLTGTETFFTYSDTIKGELLYLPRYLSSNVKNLLEGLLSRDINTRLGSQGPEEVKNHPWCEEINWIRILKKKLVPPFRPNLKISNFDPEIMQIPVNIDIQLSQQNENLDFMSNFTEKTDWSTPELFFVESNNVVFSERTSTDAEDTFNSLCAARSLDTSVLQQRSFENTESFTLPTSEGKGSDFKSLSPDSKIDGYYSIKTLLRSVTEFPRRYLLEDPSKPSLQIPNFSEDVGKMKECIRKKISLKK